MKFLNYIALLVILLVTSVFSISAQDDTLVIWADDTRAPILEAVGAQFEEDFGVSVVLHDLGFGDIRDQLKTAGPAGEGPDILIVAHDWLGELAVNGLLAEIDFSDIEDQFLPAAVSAFVYEGVNYGLPYAAENVAFIRNLDLVPENPETWDEVREISEALIANGDASYGWVIFDSDPYHFFPVQTAFGGYVFGLTDEGYDPTDVGVDNEGAIAAGDYLQAYVADGIMPTGVDYEVMHALFETGEAAMIITGPWAIPRIVESGVNFAIDGLPAGPGGSSKPFLGVQGFAISAFSEKQILAEAFLFEYLATAEVMEQMYNADPRPPAFLELRESLEDESMRGFIAAGTEGLAMPAIPEMSAVWSAWGNAMTLIRTSDVSSEEAYSTAGEQIRALIAGEDG